MSPRPGLAAQSRDNHLTLRRVERQHRILDRLLAGNEPVTAPRLAGELGVSQRTVVRDLQRLRDSGVPLEVRAGPHGGVRLGVPAAVAAIRFDAAEIAALVATLVALGPTASEPAASAMRKLIGALGVAGARPH